MVFSLFFRDLSEVPPPMDGHFNEKIEDFPESHVRLPEAIMVIWGTPLEMVETISEKWRFQWVYHGFLRGKSPMKSYSEWSFQ